MHNKVYFQFEFQSGGWGGGNQFLKALRGELASQQFVASTPNEARFILFNAHQHAQQVVSLKNSLPDKVFIHRMDGLYKLYNTPNDMRQDVAFELNQKIADGTIFQTRWAQEEHVNFGLNLNKPYRIIGNAPDASLFNRHYQRSPSDKIRLICTSWSINKNKGFEYYKFLDNHLDFNKYSFTYIGNDPGVQFKNIKKIGPLNSLELSQRLKQADIFLTGSRYECCSNSLLEAMSCGLPSIGLKSGGTPEIIGEGGESFTSKDDIIGNIEMVANNLDTYISKITVPTIKEIAKKYISFFSALLPENEKS